MIVGHHDTRHERTIMEETLWSSAISASIHPLLPAALPCPHTSRIVRSHSCCCCCCADNTFSSYRLYNPGVSINAPLPSTLPIVSSTLSRSMYVPVNCVAVFVFVLFVCRLTNSGGGWVWLRCDGWMNRLMNNQVDFATSDYPFTPEELGAVGDGVTMPTSAQAVTFMVASSSSLSAFF